MAGILLIWSWPRVRYLPVVMAERLADVALQHKTMALAYVIGAFVVVPLLGIVIL